jgi:hypothetical protein
MVIDYYTGLAHVVGRIFASLTSSHPRYVLTRQVIILNHFLFRGVHIFVLLLVLVVDQRRRGRVTSSAKSYAGRSQHTRRRDSASF